MFCAPSRKFHTITLGSYFIFQSMKLVNKAIEVVMKFTSLYKSAITPHIRASAIHFNCNLVMVKKDRF